MRRARPFAFLLGSLLVAFACGGSTATSSDAGATADGSADTAGDSDAAICVTIDPTTYDRSCAGDSDCTLIASGTLCTGSCGCGGATINKSGQAKYEAATAAVKLLACPCASPGATRCIQGTCTLCTFGPRSPPGCSDAG